MLLHKQKEIWKRCYLLCFGNNQIDGGLIKICSNKTGNVRAMEVPDNFTELTEVIAIMWHLEIHHVQLPIMMVWNNEK